MEEMNLADRYMAMGSYVKTVRPDSYRKILPFQYQKDLPVHHYFCLSAAVSEILISGNRPNFRPSFGKVPKRFTCPPLFLPVPDRRTVSNFHPCVADIYTEHSCTRSTFDGTVEFPGLSTSALCIINVPLAYTLKRCTPVELPVPNAYTNSFVICSCIYA